MRMRRQAIPMLLKGGSLRSTICIPIVTARGGWPWCHISLMFALSKQHAAMPILVIGNFLLYSTPAGTEAGNGHLMHDSEMMKVFCMLGETVNNKCLIPDRNRATMVE